MEIKQKIIYKMKRKAVCVLLLAAILINVCNISFASSNNENITVIERWCGVIPFSYHNEERFIYTSATKDEYLPVYVNKKNVTGGVEFTPTKIEKCNDSTIINILKNGFGGKTLEQLHCSEVQAFLATQEAIYIKKEGRNVSDYETFDDDGRNIIQLAQQIVDDANKENNTQNNTNDINEKIELSSKDEYWRECEDDSNFKYKEYTVLSTTQDEGKIEIQKGENVRIIDSNTKMTKQTFMNNDTFYLIVPKNVEQEIKVKFSCEKEQFSVYTFKESETSEDIYFLPKFETKEIFESISGNIIGDSKVKIMNKDIKTNEPIAGNTFSILKEDNTPIKENLVTDEKGIINITLDNGKYYLKQTGTVGKYSINKSLIEISIANHEPVTINIKSSEGTQEESTNVEKEINVNEENKKVIENNIKEVSNITTTNINKEIINETNETNLNNVNNFINTINRKNVLNLEKENTYRNYIEETTLQNKILEGENKTLNMTRQDYINYIDMIMLNSAKVPILPVASK